VKLGSSCTPSPVRISALCQGRGLGGGPHHCAGRVRVCWRWYDAHAVVLLRLYVAVLQTNIAHCGKCAITASVCVSYENITTTRQQCRKHACLTVHHQHLRVQHLWKVMCWSGRGSNGWHAVLNVLGIGYAAAWVNTGACLCFCSHSLHHAAVLGCWDA
jgi:hypothetical protein